MIRRSSRAVTGGCPVASDDFSGDLRIRAIGEPPPTSGGPSSSKVVGSATAEELIPAMPKLACHIQYWSEEPEFSLRQT